jgi:hypothetical protein
MVGIPEYCQTKKDWQNAVDFAVKTNNGKKILYSRLKHLRDDHFMKALKEGSKGKPVEELTEEDYELMDNPAAAKYKIGITDFEINALMEVLA